jgi:sugar phosphate permease
MILQSMALQSDQSVGTRNPCAILLYVYMTLIVLLYEHAPEGPCFMLLTIVSALQARGRACVDVV